MSDVDGQNMPGAQNMPDAQNMLDAQNMPGGQPAQSFPAGSAWPAVPVSHAGPVIPVNPVVPAGPPGWDPGWSAPSWQGATPPAPAVPQRKRHRKGRALKALAVGTAVVAGVGIGHTIWQPANGVASDSFSNSSGGSGSTGASGSGSLPAGSGTESGSGASSIASAVDPGLVDINVTLSYQNEEAAGTGMVLTSTGEVLTNNHVIDGATSISVTDIGNGRTYSASVVGYDRTHDVAVLQLHDASGLHTVSIGNSSSVAVGDTVVGIGNAGGTGGTPSVASGSITALNQTITASDEGSGTSEQLTGLLETDANIQPGDSGGPLVNAAGQVIGMDTAGSNSSSGQGSATQAYAIPINRALSLAKQMEAGDRSATVHIGTTAMLGVEVESTSQTSQGGSFGLGGQGGSDASGVTIANVVSGSPADDGGLAAGDVITAVGGTAVDSPDALSAALAGYHPGSSVQIQWLDQSGQQDSATITLTAGPPQ